MVTMLNPNAIQKGSITKDMIDASVLDAKQNTTDESLATTSKEVVGAINELFNGGVKNKSIVSDKIADYSITMSKLNRAGSYVPDLGLSAMHNLDITLTGEGKTGSATLQSNGVTYDQSNNIVYAIDSIIRHLGNGVTLIITEPVAGSSFGTEYVGTVTGVTNRSSTELSAIVKNLTDNKDYFVVVNLVNYEFITKISLTEQLPKIASLEMDVTSLLGKVGTNVKEISYKSMGNQIPNIDDITETGIYILSDGEKYNGSTYSNLPADLRYSNVKLLIVSPTYQSSDYQRQTLIAINYSSLVGICTREAYTNGFVNIPFSYTSIQSAIEGKLDNTSSLTDTEVNNIWDNN